MKSFDVTTITGIEYEDAENWIITSAGALVLQVNGRAVSAFSPSFWQHIAVSAVSE